MNQHRNKEHIIYFDNAATSWPKPPGVSPAISRFLEEIGASPGRSGHRLAIKAGRLVYSVRESIANLFHFSDPLRVVFTQNATAGLNMVVHGILRPGDHVITSSVEHNSMMRPLRNLEQQGVDVTMIQCTPAGFLELDHLEHAIRINTVMIAVNHASNVIGTILPIREVGQIARKHDLLFLVDAAQTAGAYPIDMPANAIDLLVFTGHKSLLGPTGTGGVVFGERVDLNSFQPLLLGGTGSQSELEKQPGFLPDMCESGTLNVAGIAGLQAGVCWLKERTVKNIRQLEVTQTQHLISGLQAIPDVSVYGCLNAQLQTATVSFNINGKEPSEVGLELDERFDIMCRVGLHCSPATHKTIGTFPTGTVRFSLGAFNTSEEVERALDAVSSLAKEK